MFNVGPGELIIVALVLLIAVGPEQLPGVIRRAGNAIGQVKSMTEGLRSDFMSGMDEIERATDPNAWAASAGPSNVKSPAAKAADEKPDAEPEPEVEPEVEAELGSEPEPEAEINSEPDVEPAAEAQDVLNGTEGSTNGSEPSGGSEPRNGSEPGGGSEPRNGSESLEGESPASAESEPEPDSSGSEGSA